MYRGEMHGQLPFDVKGMDDAVPTIDFTPNRVTDPPYSLERVDVDGAVPHFSFVVFHHTDRFPAVHLHLQTSSVYWPILKTSPTLLTIPLPSVPSRRLGRPWKS